MEIQQLAVNGLNMLLKVLPGWHQEPSVEQVVSWPQRPRLQFQRAKPTMTAGPRSPASATNHAGLRRLHCIVERLFARAIVVSKWPQTVPPASRYVNQARSRRARGQPQNLRTVPGFRKSHSPMGRVECDRFRVTRRRASRKGTRFGLPRSLRLSVGGQDGCALDSDVGSQAVTP